MELGRLYLLGFNLICVSALAFAGIGFFLRLIAHKLPQGQSENGDSVRTTSKPPMTLRPE